MSSPNAPTPTPLPGFEWLANERFMAPALWQALWPRTADRPLEADAALVEALDLPQIVVDALPEDLKAAFDIGSEVSQQFHYIDLRKHSALGGSELLGSMEYPSLDGAKLLLSGPSIASSWKW
jgi:hypothetical protein